MRTYLKVQILATFGSQRSFAQAISRSDDWLSRIIKGIKIPKPEEKKLIREKLGFNVDQEELLFFDWEKK